MTGDLWQTHSGEETEALGAKLLGFVPPPGTPCQVIELRGELGSGKSTFTRGALRALGVAGHIKSPSYTLLETYDPPGVRVVHLDLYRLNDPDELEHLGLADYHRPGYLWLIEWPERGAGRLPVPDRRFEFSIAADHHRIESIEILAPNK
ncbi:MAG: tRNA (adenosine(37)-N6)-threonylcarbamoyltransferase complex ATPase subunit type 1 TsaE [Pseudomonadota bacterium]